VLEHFVDTQPGNSGSPVIIKNADGEEYVIAIHEGGNDCNPAGAANSATSMANMQLWRGIEEAREYLIEQKSLAAEVDYRKSPGSGAAQAPY